MYILFLCYLKLYRFKLSFLYLWTFRWWNLYLLFSSNEVKFSALTELAVNLIHLNLIVKYFEWCALIAKFALVRIFSYFVARMFCNSMIIYWSVMDHQWQTQQWLITWTSLWTSLWTGYSYILLVMCTCKHQPCSICSRIRMIDRQCFLCALPMLSYTILLRLLISIWDVQQPVKNMTSLS